MMWRPVTVDPVKVIMSTRASVVRNLAHQVVRGRHHVDHPGGDVGLLGR